MKKTRWNWFWFLHWRRQGPIVSNLEIDSMSATLTVPVGATGHSATLSVTNLDGSPATNASVTYTSSDTGVCTVDVSTGALGFPGHGTATITGSASRDSFTHSDTAVITVTDPNSGDFTVSMGLK